VISKYQNNLKFKSLPYEEVAMKTDSTLKEKRERWHESLAKDVYVEEAVNVLDDLKNTSSKGASTKLKKTKLLNLK